MHHVPDYTTFPVSKVIEIHWGDMDELGHVNNIMYFRYFETARIVYLQHVGAGDFNQREDVPVVVSIQMNYRLPIVFPARVAVYVRTAEVKQRSFVMQCVMVEEGTSTVYADGQCTVVWISRATGKAIPLPMALREGIQHLEAQHLEVQHREAHSGGQATQSASVNTR
jgi:acyl-CoA thioester hydrolase